jgi:hypothetical protein
VLRENRNYPIGVTAYHAAYLELRKGHPLATLDAALLIAVRSEKVPTSD